MQGTAQNIARELIEKAHMVETLDDLEALVRLCGRKGITQDQRYLDMRIDRFHWTVRTSNCLHNAGVKTLGELLTKSDRDLLRMKNLGRSSLREITDIKRIIMSRHYETGANQKSFSKLFAAILAYRARLSGFGYAAMDEEASKFKVRMILAIGFE